MAHQIASLGYIPSPCEDPLWEGPRFPHSGLLTTVSMVFAGSGGGQPDGGVHKKCEANDNFSRVLPRVLAHAISDSLPEAAPLHSQLRHELQSVQVSMGVLHRGDGWIHRPAGAGLGQGQGVPARMPGAVKHAAFQRGLPAPKMGWAPDWLPASITSPPCHPLCFDL